MSISTHSPIYLEGENLGARHRYYNSIIQSVDKKLEFQSIEQLSEISPINKIFAIDLASDRRNLEYILKVLQDEDMLYVTRALKSLWLLEPQYTHIINPRYLEANVFPNMIQPAANKMRHWLQLQLKDPERCEDFYDYYKDKFNVAIKFLYHCSSNFISKEFLNIIDKINPKTFKILCEVCPQVSKVYYENLPLNRPVLVKYLDEERNFLRNLKHILKVDGNLYLDIMEKHFNDAKMSKLNPSATDFIMKKFRSRFNAKRELYATKFLHMKTLAKHLSAEEARDLIIQLARAEFLKNWFTYQNVEPLIKRLNFNERAQFKKQIFVDKCIEVTIKEWPYPIPIPFEIKDLDSDRVFLDEERDSYIFEHEEIFAPRLLKKRKLGYQCAYAGCPIIDKRKSPLDILFDRYRISGFEHTFLELSKNILTEITVEGRLNMILVLVSKSGGFECQVEKLLKWLNSKHINEPINLRAAVVRSLVKRGSVWRLPLDLWNSFLDFGRDLGLNGQPAELLCREGLHAVVIKHLLTDSNLNPKLRTAFTAEFSTLHEYNLNFAEKAVIGERLARCMVGHNPDHLLDVVDKYHLKIDQVEDALNFVVKAAKDDTNFLRRLYDVKIGRREIMQQTFSQFQNNASFVNALRHDTSLLEGGKCFAELVAKESSSHDRFLQSLSLYFNEPNGLAAQHKSMLDKTLAENPNWWLARPICFLSTESDLLNLLSKFNIREELEKKKKQLAASIRANAHKTKPPLDVNKVDWQWIGSKAIANRYLVCRSKDLNTHIERLLQSKRTARIALRLALATPYLLKTFISVSSLRPSVALKIVLSEYFKRKTFDPELWNVTKQLITKLDSTTDKRLLDKLRKVSLVPKNIKADYFVSILQVFVKVDQKKVASITSKLENLLPDVDEVTIELLIKQFISDYMNKDEFVQNTMNNHEKCLYIRIIAKYLLTCKSKASQADRIKGICDVFFDKLSILFETCKENTEYKDDLKHCLKEFLYSLKYNKVFLDKRYVSCLPVFERVIERLREILPTENNLEDYIEIHLTMLYYKSMKQAMKQKPIIFDDLKNNRKEAVEMVGLIFGTYIGHEIKELVSVYFLSIIDIYKQVLNQYLNSYFEYNDRMSMLVVFTLKGLLNVGNTESLLLVEYILRHKYSFNISVPQQNEIFDALKTSKTKEVSFFVHAYHAEFLRDETGLKVI